MIIPDRALVPNISTRVITQNQLLYLFKKLGERTKLKLNM